MTAPTIPATMKPWHGGDAPPADWDGGPVLTREGKLRPVRDTPWRWSNTRWPRKPLSDIIAYAPTPAVTEPTEAGIRYDAAEMPPEGWPATPNATPDHLTRPIPNIEARTPQEVFDIMADRIRHASIVHTSSYAETLGAGEGEV